MLAGWVWVPTPSQILSVQGNVLISGDLTSLANLTATGTLTQNAFAYTALTASTEKSDVNLNLARTVQFSAGNLATQRAVLIQAPTYSFTASSTLTDASTLLITGAPVAGVYTTSTNNYGLKIDAGSVRGTGAIAPDNAYGLYVSAPAVATNNYGAVFASGNVGLGTASPADKFTVSSGHITATNNSSSSTLQEDALIVNQTVGTYDLGRFYVDASGKVSASVLFSPTAMLPTGNLYALSGSASTSILNGSSLTLGQGLLNSGIFNVDSSGNVSASGTLTMAGDYFHFCWPHSACLRRPNYFWRGITNDVLLILIQQRRHRDEGAGGSWYI